MSSSPRITFSRTKDGSLEIWLNPAGRDLLVSELQRLSEQSDHFHIMPEEMEPELPTRSQPYEDGDEVIQWGKVLFRTDEWDNGAFPSCVGRHRPRCQLMASARQSAPDPLRTLLLRLALRMLSLCPACSQR
jgi:hypothetical protein